MSTASLPSGKFQLLTRLGFVARALLYGTIAVLVLSAGRSEDPAGALQVLGTGLGPWLLLLLMAGLAGYGLWRLADAVFGMESGRGSGEAVARRLGAGGSGAMHLFLAWQAFHLWQGTRIAPGDPAQEHARFVLELPGGVIVLALLAFALLVAGVWQFITAAQCSFLETLDAEAGHREWIRWLGRFGYAARGIIFLLCGFFLARSAWEDEPSEAGGMERALDWLSTPVETAVAAGLLLFAAYSLVEARYRRIRRPPVERVARGMVG